LSLLLLLQDMCCEVEVFFYYYYSVISFCVDLGYKTKDKRVESIDEKKRTL